MPDGRFCAACGADTDLAVMASDATRFSTPSSPSTPSTSSGHASSGQGWLSSSGSIDHGRFAPGAVIDNRYRIIGLLGRGGMGEVYRAINNAMLGVFGLAVLRAGLQRASPRLGHTAVAFTVATLLFTPLAARGQFQSGILGLDLAFGLVLVLVILGIIFRLGLFAGIVGFFCHFWTWGVAVTLDSSRPYFETGLVALALAALVATTGLALTRTSRTAV